MMLPAVGGAASPQALLLAHQLIAQRTLGPSRRLEEVPRVGARLHRAASKHTFGMRKPTQGEVEPVTVGAPPLVHSPAWRQSVKQIRAMRDANADRQLLASANERRCVLLSIPEIAATDVLRVLRSPSPHLRKRTVTGAAAERSRCVQLPDIVMHR